MVAVVVRQGTVRPEGRGLCSAGPAGNTGHCGSRWRADSTTTRKEGRRISDATDAYVDEDDAKDNDDGDDKDDGEER